VPIIDEKTVEAIEYSAYEKWPNKLFHEIREGFSPNMNCHVFIFIIV
jgi:hypothetical protein